MYLANYTQFSDHSEEIGYFRKISYTTRLNRPNISHKPMKQPSVCVTLRGRTSEEMISDAPKAIKMGADLLEVRLDFLWTTEEKIRTTKISDEGEKDEVEVSVGKLDFEEVDYQKEIERISSSIEAPILMVCRPQDRRFSHQEDERFSVLRSAISANPSWIDLEIDIPAQEREELVSLAVGGRTQIIASFHSLEGVPSTSEITKDISEAQEMGDIVKACYSTSDRKDALRIFEAALELKSTSHKYCVMGLGPGGDWARIHAPVLGQGLVFATTESGWHLAQQGRINGRSKMAWEVMEYSNQRNHHSRMGPQSSPNLPFPVQLSDTSSG